MFLPLKDNIPTLRTPVLTIALIVLNCVVFVFFEGNTTSAETTVVGYGAVPYELTHPGSKCVPVSPEDTAVHCGPRDLVAATTGDSYPPAWITVLTSMFLHAGLLHLIGNMLFLFVFGMAVEDALGRWKFILFYLIGGIAAVLGQTLFDTSETGTMVGASGAIASVMGAYLVLFPRVKVTSLLFLFIPCHPRAVWVIGTWLIEQAALAWVIAGSGAEGGVAVFAHWGGFLAGCALTWMILGRDGIDEQRLRARYASGDELVPGPPPVPAHALAQMPPPGQPPAFVGGPAPSAPVAPGAPQFVNSGAPPKYFVPGQQQPQPPSG